jgi:acyl carrier protein
VINIDNKIKKVISIVFEIDVDNINDNSSPDNIENWDSLRHLILIGALEDEFDIQFSDDEMTELLNFKLIKFTISDKIN